MDVVGLQSILGAQSSQQTMDQMMASHAQSMQNSNESSAVKMMQADQEHQRTTANSITKQSAELQSDAQSQVKNSLQKLDQSAAA